MQCCSSHDLIAHLMNVACTVATEKQNATRAELQTSIQALMFARIDEWHDNNNNNTGEDAGIVLPPVEWTYELMANFTRSYICSYMPDPTKEQDIRFVPVVDIDRTHPVHASALDFQKAQDTLYGRCSMDCIRDYDRMSYAELVQLSVARVMDCSS
jgi:hypothetical protein